MKWPGLWVVAACLLATWSVSAQQVTPVVAGSSALLYQVQDPQIQAATLFYRTEGSQQFMRQPLHYQDGQWSITFRGKQLRAPGVEYYIQFKMKDGSSKTEPAQYPRYNPLRLPVVPRGQIAINLNNREITPDQPQILFQITGTIDELSRFYIDDIDVTDIVQRDGDQWILSNDSQLFSGESRLQVISAEGRVLATQPLHFVDAPSPQQVIERELVLRGNASFSLGGQRDSSQNDQGPLALSGNLHAESEYQEGDFKSHFSGVNINYQRGADPAFNLSSGFLFTNTYRNHTLQFGDVSISGTPLVLSGFSRRGLLLKSENDRWSGSIFNVRTSAIEGWESGVSLDNRQTYGISGEQQLGKQGHSSIQWVLVSGALQQPESVGVTTTEKQPHTGDTVGVLLNTRLGETKIAAQIAASRFDADTRDAVAAQKDNAYQLTMSRDIYGLASSLGLHRYGADYATIAQPNFSNDRQGLDLSLDGQYQMIGWSSSLATTQDNIEKDLSRPIVTSRNAGLNLDFIVEDWPALNTGLSVSEQRSHNEPAIDQRINNRGENLTVGLSDTIGSLNLSWNSSIGRLKSRLDARKDSNTRNHALNLGYSAEVVQLSLNIAQNSSQTQVTQLSDQFNLSADFPLFAEKIMLNSQFSFQRNSASDGSQNNKTFGGSARIAWSIQDMFSAVTASWADAQFALSWRYNRRSDRLDPASDLTDQRLLLEFSMGAPVNFEQRWKF